jgi:hypothetical protein
MQSSALQALGVTVWQPKPEPGVVFDVVPGWRIICQDNLQGDAGLLLTNILKYLDFSGIGYCKMSPTDLALPAEQDAQQGVPTFAFVSQAVLSNMASDTQIHAYALESLCENHALKRRVYDDIIRSISATHTM